MQILLSFLQSPHKHPIAAYDFWQHYLKKGIEEAGHTWMECPEVDWALGVVPKSESEQAEWRQQAWGKTLTYLKHNRVDLFLSYLYPEQIDAEAIRKIRSMGIPCVNFFCDNVRLFRKIPAEFSVFDLNWVPEYRALAMYKKAGYAHIHLPMPCWVVPERRVFSPERNSQVSFIGSKDIQRQLFLEQVVAMVPDMDLAIYGNGWADNSLHKPAQNDNYTFAKKIKYQFTFIGQNGIAGYIRKIKQRGYDPEISAQLMPKLHGIRDFDDYNTLTSGSCITLGMNRYPSFRFPLAKPDSYSRLRDIEAPMLGACYLTEYTEGIDQLYDISTEIETYKTPEELIEKVCSLKGDPDKRERLKRNGQQRALNEHNIANSLRKIISHLNI